MKKTRQRVKEETDEVIDIILDQFEKDNKELLFYICRRIRDKSLEGNYTFTLYYGSIPSYMFYLVKWLLKLGFTVDFNSTKKTLFISWE